MSCTRGAPCQAIVGLLERRAPGQTICPSEAARVLAGSTGDWRSYMEQIHLAADQLHDKGYVELTWKGVKLAKRCGPYRIVAARRTD